jgi:hypothetical protein
MFRANTRATFHFPEKSGRSHAAIHENTLTGHLRSKFFDRVIVATSIL